MAKHEVASGAKRRKTIREFDKEIARFGGASRELDTTLPAFARAGFRARLLIEINRARRFGQRLALVTCELQALATGDEPLDAGTTGRMLRHRGAPGVPDLQARFAGLFFPDDGDNGEALLYRLEHPD